MHTLMHSRDHRLDTLRIVQSYGANTNPLGEPTSTFPGVDNQEIDATLPSNGAQWRNVSVNRKRLHVFGFEHLLYSRALNAEASSDPGARCLSLDLAVGARHPSTVCVNNFVPAVQYLAHGGSPERLHLWFRVPAHTNPLVLQPYVDSLANHLDPLPVACLQMVTLRDKQPFVWSDDPQRFVALYGTLLHRVRVREHLDLEVRILPEGVHIRNPVPFVVHRAEFTRNHDGVFGSRVECGIVFTALERLWNTGTDTGHDEPVCDTIEIQCAVADSEVYVGLPFPRALVDGDLLTTADQWALYTPIRGVDDLRNLRWIADLLQTTGGHVPRYHTQAVAQIRKLTADGSDWGWFASVVETVDHALFLRIEAKGTLLRLLGGHMAEHFPVSHDQKIPCWEPDMQEEVSADAAFLDRAMSTDWYKTTLARFVDHGIAR